MLERAQGLSPAALAAVAGLEQRVVTADGGRLKLEWGVLRARPGDRVEDLLWWDGDRLVGFLGLYAFGGPSVELSGMVDPGARRRGIATALLDAALGLCRERGVTTTLLVTPRTPPAGRELALARGARLDHSEHALQLVGEPAGGPDAPITVRAMTVDDDAVVVDLLSFGFGRPASSLRRDRADTLVVERDGVVVGTLRLTWDGDAAGIHGFVVHPRLQGRGIGRAVLRRVCRTARADGAQRVHLEVAVDNDRALGLYTSVGFTHQATEDYYALPLAVIMQSRGDHAILQRSSNPATHLSSSGGSGASPERPGLRSGVSPGNAGEQAVSPRWSRSPDTELISRRPPPPPGPRGQEIN